MKSTLVRIASLIFIVILIFSCSKEDEPMDETPIDETAAYTGSFVSSAHPTSGNASINMEMTELNLTDFKSDNGPNLDVYLVSNLADVDSDFINLGNIKGLDGNFTYEVPDNVDFTVYKYVVIWCKDFSVNFGYATLSK